MSTLRLHYSPMKGHWWFTLHASNHKVLMTSETYTTKRAAEKGMAATKLALTRLQS